MKTDKHTITLTYKEGDPAGPWFMSTKLTVPPTGKGHYGTLKVKKGDDAVFTFSIKTKDIAFDPKNPIEIRLQDPQKPGDHKQFTIKPIDPLKPDELEVTDPNNDQVLTDYYYQLNFVGKPPLDPVIPPLDPIIQNGCCQRSDGGGGFQMLSGPGLIGLALLAAAAIALIVVRSRRNRAQG